MCRETNRRDAKQWDVDGLRAFVHSVGAMALEVEALGLSEFSLDEQVLAVMILDEVDREEALLRLVRFRAERYGRLNHG